MKRSGECANLEIDSGQRTGTLTLDFAVTQTIDMKQALGDMYLKYNKFLIILNTVSGFSTATTYNAGSITAITNAGVWTLGMTGLDWENNTYNGSLTNLAFFPTRFTLPTSSYSSISGIMAIPQNGLCFRRPDNPNVTLSLNAYLTRAGGTAVGVSGTTVVLDFNFSFSIYGLSEDD